MDQEDSLPTQSRIAGLQGLYSPALRSKVLPWLGGVENGDPSEGSDIFSRGPGGSRSASSPLPSDQSSVPSRPLRSDPPMATTLGSPINLVSNARTSARHHHSRTVSTSTGAREEEALHGRETIGKTSGSAPPRTPQVDPSFYHHPNAALHAFKVRLPSSKTLSRSTDTSFGNPHRFTHSSALIDDGKLHATFEEVTLAPLDSPIDSTPNITQALESGQPVTAVPAPNPNKASSEKAKDVSPTPTITPDQAQSQPHPSEGRLAHLRSPGKSDGKGGGLASLGWKASMFEDRVLCQLFEMIGRPGLEDETRTMLLDLVAQRMSVLQDDTTGQDGSTSRTLDDTSSIAPHWAVNLQRDIARLREDLLQTHRDRTLEPTTPVVPSEIPRPSESLGLYFQPSPIKIEVLPPTTPLTRAHSKGDILNKDSTSTPAQGSPSVTGQDSRQALRDLVERSLPPTPPSEATLSLADEPSVDAVQKSPIHFRQATDSLPSFQPKPPSVHSEISGDLLLPALPHPRPWDLVTSRLYAWAILWQDESFARALEQISLDKQIGPLALTIFSTVTFKRYLRNKLSSAPTDVFDKMIVQPNLADLLNKAIYHKSYKDAKDLLLGLWQPLNLDKLNPSGLPRVIIALTRHRNEDDAWAVLRFDLPTSSLLTWVFYSAVDGKTRLKDERQKNWFHAIRAAWPTAGCKHPDHIQAKVQHVVLPDSARKDASLQAANCFRNVLVGWKWDRETDLPRLRELIWNEIRRLLKRKADGGLAFDPTTDPSRVDDV